MDDLNPLLHPKLASRLIIVVFTLLSIVFLAVPPAGYLTVCERMRDTRVRRPPYVSLFVLMVLLLGIELLMMVPPLLEWTPAYVWLITAALPLCCTLSLIGRSQRTAYHRVAIWGNLAVALVYVWFISKSGLGI